MMNEAQVKQAETLKKHRPAIQAWMNENVTAEKPVSAKVVYEALHESCKLTMSESSFQVLLSLNVKLGLLEGFFGRKGIKGGYLPLSCKTDEAPAPALTSDTGVGIDLGDGSKLVGEGEKWIITRANGPKLYFTTFGRAVKHASKMVSENELKVLSNDDLCLDNLPQLFDKVQENVTSRMTAILKSQLVAAPAEEVQEVEEEDVTEEEASE